MLLGLMIGTMILMNLVATWLGYEVCALKNHSIMDQTIEMQAVALRALQKAVAAKAEYEKKDEEATRVKNEYQAMIGDLEATQMLKDLEAVDAGVSKALTEAERGMITNAIDMHVAEHMRVTRGLADRLMHVVGMVRSSGGCK